MSEQQPVGVGSGSDPYGQTDLSTAKGFALSGKIMLTAIIVLFAVVLVMVFLHIYARWYLLRHPNSSHINRSRRRRRRRTTTHHLVFYVEPNDPSSIHPQIPDNNNNNSSSNNFRLDPSILKTLPTFTFTFTASSNPSDDDDDNFHECAVCLSEFEQGDLGRLLPLCGHTFHVDCIDMWFHSHSTCPLCRSPVASPPTIEADSSSVEIVVVDEESSRNINSNVTSTSTPFTPSHSSAAPPSYDLPCSSFSAHAAAAAAAGQGVVGSSSSSSSSFGGRRKVGSGVSIEIPARSASFSFTTGPADDPSPASSQGYSRSPTSRLLSLRRILSREKRPLPSPTGLPCSSSSTSSADFVIGVDQHPPPTTPKQLQGSDKV